MSTTRPCFFLNFEDYTDSTGSPRAHITQLDKTKATKQVEAPAVQDLWDRSTASFKFRIGLTREVTPTTDLCIRIEKASKGRALLLLRVPDQKAEYVFRHFKGVSQWTVRGMLTIRGDQRKVILVTSKDFYGHQLAPMPPEIFGGLEGLLRHEWDITHCRTCREAHFDVYVGIPEINQHSRLPIVPKSFTHCLVCSDTTVWTLFRTLSGIADVALTSEDLLYCLTEIIHPHSEGADPKLGKQYSFGEVRLSEITMQETEWFKTKGNATLVPSKLEHNQINS